MATSKKIDIVINERGGKAVTRALQQLADTTQKISPATARSLRGKALRIGLNIDKMIEDVGVAVLERVVHATPVDTGQARGGWTTHIRVSRSPTEGRFGNLDKSGEDTIAEGTYTIRNTTRPDGHSIIISNGLPYIAALNNGWSSQAAAGFVERAVQSGVDTVRNSKILK